ncbi:hypothetical protein NDU88_000993 [Pleurodeles waltl]|uniref:Uncharacterized protein n=1 Tax=Pleurodeles waltl TaxID=8319 RepID=A0AAV7V8E2_PLEWA|nr:hypothetical protein NDU88_000993 [Pleurodeles waltl]
MRAVASLSQPARECGLERKSAGCGIAARNSLNELRAAMPQPALFRSSPHSLAGWDRDATALIREPL